MTVQVIKYEGPWLTARVQGRKIQAKIFDEGSRFGINNGRISKLHISRKGAEGLGLRDACYNYDRGADVDEGDPVVDKIVSELEAWRA